MSRALRIAALGMLVVVSVFAGYRVLAHTLADQYATIDPRRALRWLPDHPGALLALAENQAATGDYAAATVTARHLLAVAPLEGRALRILGRVAAAAGDTAAAVVLHERAAARSPRDVPTRIWLIRHYVMEKDYALALQQMDRLMRFSPRHGAALRPLIAQFAQDNAFVDALVPMLAARPPWRESFLREVQSGRHPASARQVLEALRKGDGLSRAEQERWIEDLILQGQWGSAYGHWASALPAGAVIQPVYNGGFGHLPGNSGFDWRLRRVPGVVLTFEDDDRNDGLVAHASFRRRPVAQVGLEQALLLAPGRYRLDARMRAEGLSLESGLEWLVQCNGGRVLAASERVSGSFAWRDMAMEVEIPADCPGQWLRLRNPAPAGSAQFMAGELWVDDVAITPLPAP